MNTVRIRVGHTQKNAQYKYPDIHAYYLFRNVYK